MSEPILIATDGEHIRHLGEPNLDHYSVTEASPAVRLIHAMARARVHGCGAGRRNPCYRMSREYAETCDAVFTAPPDNIFPPPVGMFRGIPVYIDDRSNCVVLDFSDPRRHGL